MRRARRAVPIQARGADRRARALAGRCREAGMHLTPQRQAIYQALVDAHDHPSPEAVYTRVRRAMPSLSLATVYKTLEALVRLGLATELPATGNAKRYDANMEHHHHLVCSRCAAVRDYSSSALDGLAAPARLPGFTAHRVSVQIHGLCEACARAGTPAIPHITERRRSSWPVSRAPRRTRT